MTCPLCRTGNRSVGTTTITLSRDDSTIVFRHVPAKVCDTCGEASISAAVAQSLEQLAASEIAGGVRYEVRDYIAKVA